MGIPMNGRPLRTFLLRVASLAVALASTCAASTARAEENAAAASPAAEEDFHRVAITFEVLGLLESRYAVATEVVLTPRNSLVVSGFYSQSDISGDTSFLTFGGPSEYYQDTATRAYGFELQYRRYLASIKSRHLSSASSGPFIAPGFEVQHFQTSTLHVFDANTCMRDQYDYRGPCDAPPQAPAAAQDWWYVGGSLDLGFQLQTRLGFVASASIGAHWRFPTSTIDESQYPWGWEAAHGSGLRPRFRLQIGWGFL